MAETVELELKPSSAKLLAGMGPFVPPKSLEEESLVPAERAIPEEERRVGQPGTTKDEDPVGYGKMAPVSPESLGEAKPAPFKPKREDIHLVQQEGRNQDAGGSS